MTMADGWITASFNALNQPVAMWSWNYGSNYLWFGYDPLGRCVKRWTGDINGAPVGAAATYYYYDGSDLVQEGPVGSLADRTYVHGGRVDEIVASQVGGLWYNHHYDGQGNCIMLTTANGGVQEQYDYDAFGFPYFYSATGGKFTSAPHTRFLLTGREWLRDLRIYDYRARQYQPELGRFLQPDPQEFGAGDYNLYRYCHNDPVNRSDPTGEIGWPGAAYGAIAGAAGEVLLEGAENMLRDRPFFGDLNYSHIGIAAAVGAGSGALGYGVATQSAKAITASKRVYHVRQVLAARRAAERAGKFRNALKTAKMQAEAAAKTRAALLAAARGAAGPAVKRAIDAALDSAGQDTDDKGEKQIEKK
jgi:RHS repeat-associated protein